MAILSQAEFLAKYTALLPTSGDGSQVFAFLRTLIQDIDDSVAFGAASGVADGDKGDITVSSGGTAWAIDARAVSYAKIQAMATGKILGRTTASSGDIEENTVTTPLTFAGNALGLAGLSALGTANQILGMNNAGTAYEYKTISIGTTAQSNDIGVVLSGANAIVLHIPDATAAVRGVITTGTQSFGGGKTWGGTATFNAVVQASVASGSAQLRTGSSGSSTYRTTNGGSNLTAEVNIDPASSVTAGISWNFDSTNGFVITQGNGTRRIAGAAIQTRNLTSTAGSEAMGLSFLTQLAGAAMAERLGITPGGGFVINTTVTAGGTTGAQTINKPSGTVNFAAAAASLVVTNNLVTANSLVFCEVRTNDSTAIIKNVVPAAGSFTITLNAAATAETSVGFFVIN